MKFSFVTTFVVLMALAGCHRRPVVSSVGGDCTARPGQIVTNGQIKVTLDDLRDDAVLVSVGNRCYRKRDYLLDRQEMLDTVAKAFSNPRERAKKIQEVSAGMPWRFASTFVNRMPFVLEGRALGIEPTTNDIAMARRVREHASKMLGLSLDVYADRYHGGLDKLNVKIREEASNKAVFRVLFTNSLDITDAEIAKLRQELEVANQIVAASNAVLRAEFEHQRAKILSGGLSIPEDASEGEMPDGMEIDHFEGVVADYFDDDAKLLVELQSLTNGAWTAIHETDEEYAIFTITEFKPRNFQSPDFYSGTKVAVKKDMGYLVPDVKRARNDLRYIKNRDIVLPKTQELAKKYGVVFPNGTHWADAPLRNSAINKFQGK